ncbi:transposase [Pseudomonas sp. MAFF 730085]|uniref:Transposase n=1 Tax=Pseudomonas kitaguniensis TaxID=2607908 RepID=A0A5N7JPC3_9PSED|nr:transposase [Pseudomonas kitaguniensis]MPQ83113.1 transposase [Pseudomonas kitaguniensis]
MNSSEFVTGLKNSVVHENFSSYKNLYLNTNAESATDDYWKNSLTLFNSLTNEQKTIFFEIIKQTIIDTTSNILGVIDGATTIAGARDEFSLSYGKDEKSLEGDLQSLFLAEL